MKRAHQVSGEDSEERTNLRRARYGHIMDINLRQAVVNDSEFAYQTKKATLRPYVEMVCGWDEADQRQMHDRH